MTDQTNENHRRSWCLENAKYYKIRPATLYMLLLFAHEPWWELVSEETRLQTIGQWFDADTVILQRRLLKVQKTAFSEYQWE